MTDLPDEDLLSLRRQLANARENLNLIEERESEYPLSTDVPLLLVKEKRRLLARIDELEQRLAARQVIPSQLDRRETSPGLDIVSSPDKEAFVEYYSCFISYSTHDQTFAERLHSDLQAKGVSCWFAPEDIAGGKKLHEQIDQAIRLHDKLLLVLSEHSIGSEWVMTEIRRTRKAELKENRRKLFPIRLVDMDTLKGWECFDADAGKDLAVEVREYFIPDFSGWENHTVYQRAFDRLLRDLKAEEG
jgi:hypothetical protein